MPGGSTKGAYVGKTSVTAFKRRCPDSELSGQGGLVREILVNVDSHLVWGGVDSEIVLRLGSTFLGSFFFPGEPKDFGLGDRRVR